MKIKNEFAVALGKLGGQARARKLSAKQQSDIGKQAINARWDKYRATKTPPSTAV